MLEVCIQFINMPKKTMYYVEKLRKSKIKKHTRIMNTHMHAFRRQLGQKLF